MRQNDPHSAPPGTPKGCPNPSKIITKSSLSRRGCLQVTSRGYPHPNIPKINNKNKRNFTNLGQSMDTRSYSRTKTKWRAFRPVFLDLGAAFQQAEYRGLGGTKPRNKQHIFCKHDQSYITNYQAVIVCSQIFKILRTSSKVGASA